MPQPYELKNLFKQGQYDQVVAYWKDPNEVAQFSEWDFQVMMESFYKLKCYQDCLEVYRKCYAKFPKSTLLDDKMGWAIYYTKVKDFDFQHGDVKVLLRQIDYVFQHSSDTQYSPRWRLAKFVAKATEDGKFGYERDYHLALQYLDMVNPDMLSKEESPITGDNGKHMASDRESWYSHKTKLLLKAQDYKACIACCDQALRALRGVRLHNNNDSWFHYRKAQCLQALNQTDEARKCVEGILQSGFRSWPLLQLMFEFEAAAGNKAKALAYAGQCALFDSSHKMRVSFYEDLADYLEREGETEIPMLLRKFVLLLRAKEEWGEKSRHAEWKFSDAIAAMDESAVLKHLTPIWREWRDKDKVFLTGTIVHLQPEGKSGHIAADNGGSYYFNARDFLKKGCTPQIGMKVKFTLIKKLDKSKGVVKENAVEITVLQGGDH